MKYSSFPKNVASAAFAAAGIAILFIAVMRFYGVSLK